MKPRSGDPSEDIVELMPSLIRGLTVGDDRRVRSLSLTQKGRAIRQARRYDWRHLSTAHRKV